MGQVVKFYAHLFGEDGTEFMVDCQCLTREDMEGWLEECYPEATVDYIRTAEEIQEEEARRYNRLSDELDSGLYYE